MNVFMKSKFQSDQERSSAYHKNFMKDNLFSSLTLNTYEMTFNKRHWYVGENKEIKYVQTRFHVITGLACFMNNAYHEARTILNIPF